MHGATMRFIRNSFLHAVSSKYIIKFVGTIYICLRKEMKYGRDQHHYLISLTHKTWPVACVI